MNKYGVSGPLNHRYRHGMTDTKTWKSWAAMLHRCSNVNCKCYPRYGGRGIKVHPSWAVFENFLADMGICPNDKTLDRWPNPNGNYEPGNCRWATAFEQNRNKENNHLITFNGETLAMSEWAERAGMRSITFRKRIDAGWSPEKAITTPVKVYAR